ncbi:MAG TPA: sensor domain-containing diguanylate cyclase [Armatimonadetes bacterium]|nr:sensor domain-containing diguanylate cyclase [Armatimonadota bacterium]
MPLRTEEREEVFKAAKLSEILRATAKISESKSSSEVVDLAVEAVWGLLEVDRCSVVLLDEQNGELRVVAQRGMSDWVVEQCRWKAGEGLVGWAVEHGQTVAVDNVALDPRYKPIPDGAPLERAIVCVPFKVGGKVKGAICADRMAGEGALKTWEVEYLELLARHVGVALENARIYEDLSQHVKQLSTLYEVGAALGTVINVDRLLNLIVDSVVKVTGAQICSLMLLDKKRKVLRIRVAKGLPRQVIKRTEVRLGEGISGWVAKTGEPLLIEDIEKHPIFRRKSMKRYTTKSLLSVPLKVRGEVIGVLNVNNKPTGPFTETDKNLLMLFASQAAVAIERANLYKNLERLATTDGLTGLYVHRYFQQELAKELRRAKRYNRPLSLVMMDIDDFKRLNDTYGHPEGDLVLKEIARILRRHARQEDVVARYGGEEFAIILLETGKEGAMIAADRLRRAVEGHKFALDGKKVDVTVSAGVASFPEDADTKRELIDKADEALLEAKRRGKNRVCAWWKGGIMEVTPEVLEELRPSKGRKGAKGK